VYRRIMVHHDYVWARIPFLAPMAAAVARYRPNAANVARRLRGLATLLLRHLGEEEQFLAGDADAAVSLIGNGMMGEHLMISTALDEIRDAAARWPVQSELERRLGSELALLDEHLQAQIALEEQFVATLIGVLDRRS
jgi:hypothetical protein